MECSDLKLRKPEEWNTTSLDLYDCILFDCDGVIWLEGELLPGVAEALRTLHSLGKRCVFVTNNSYKTRAHFLQRFHSFGLTHVTEDDILSSAFATAAVLSSERLFMEAKKKALLLGSDSVADELRAVGISVLPIGELVGPDGHLSEQDLFNLELDSQVGAVVCGGDMKFTYSKAAVASLYLGQTHDENQPLFLATNMDSTYPVPGRFLPGAGSIVQTIIAASGRMPVVCGKPASCMLEVAINRFGLDRSRVLMVGDRLDTGKRDANWAARCKVCSQTSPSALEGALTPC